jgi:glycerol-3-phosphate cytidylyltransferase-like family protein
VIRVYTDVVADLFHWGHVEFFHLARELGDLLVTTSSRVGTRSP